MEWNPHSGRRREHSVRVAWRLALRLKPPLHVCFRYRRGVAPTAICQLQHPLSPGRPRPNFHIPLGAPPPCSTNCAQRQRYFRKGPSVPDFQPRNREQRPWDRGFNRSASIRSGSASPSTIRSCSLPPTLSCHTQPGPVEIAVRAKQSFINLDCDLPITSTVPPPSGKVAHQSVSVVATCRPTGASARAHQIARRQPCAAFRENVYRTSHRDQARPGSHQSRSDYGNPAPQPRISNAAPLTILVALAAV